jgi:hypothetical protein
MIGIHAAVENGDGDGGRSTGYVPGAEEVENVQVPRLGHVGIVRNEGRLAPGIQLDALEAPAARQQPANPLCPAGRQLSDEHAQPVHPAYHPPAVQGDLGLHVSVGGAGTDLQDQAVRQGGGRLREGLRGVGGQSGRRQEGGDGEPAREGAGVPRN